jgi:FixJ family two-component response regulator
LTPRKCEVMTLVVAGRLNKQIVAELGLNEATVKDHCGHVMRRDACPVLGRASRDGR